MASPLAESRITEDISLGVVAETIPRGTVQAVLVPPSPQPFPAVGRGVSEKCVTRKYGQKHLGDPAPVRAASS